jgi:hypothetical protein
MYNRISRRFFFFFFWKHSSPVLGHEFACFGTPIDVLPVRWASRRVLNQEKEVNLIFSHTTHIL